MPDERAAEGLRKQYLRWAIIGFGGLLVLAVILLPPIVSGGYSLLDPVVLAALVAAPALVWIYQDSLNGHASRASRAFVFVVFIAAWVFTVSIQGSGYLVGNYAYLTVIVLLAAFFLPTSETAVYAGVNIAGVAVIHTVWGLAMTDLVLSLTYLVFFSTMLVLIASLMERDAKALQSQSQELAKTAHGLASANHDLTMIFDNTDEAMIVVLADGTLRSVNHRAEALVKLSGGAKPEVGRSFSASLPAEARHAMETHLASARRLGAVEAPIEAGGRHFVVRVVRLDDESVLVLGRDTTHAIAVQQSERERAIQDAKVEQLETLNKRQHDFMRLATVALRSPLSPIHLQLHVLRDRQTGQLVPGQLRCVDVIERNAVRLTGLVEQIEDVLRIEGKHLAVTLGDVEVVALARQEMERAIPLADAKNIGLIYDGPANAWAHAEARRVGEILRHLLDNALKFSNPGGMVQVNIQAGDMISVQVIDDGIGFDPAQQDELFKPFTQLHGAPRIYEGTGLGLAISRGYVEAQGGRIEVQSQGHGRGVSARFWLPQATQKVAVDHSVRSP